MIEMCKAVENMIQEAIEKDRMEQARKYYREGVSIEIITRVVERPLEVVMKWLGIQIA